MKMKLVKPSDLKESENSNRHFENIIKQFNGIFQGQIQNFQSHASLRAAVEITLCQETKNKIEKAYLEQGWSKVIFEEKRTITYLTLEK